MARSRGRTPRNQSEATRRREWQRGVLAARQGLRFGPADWGGVRRGIEAEARGDAGAALELHLAGPHVDGSIRESRLREMAMLGVEAPPWMISRWVVGQVPRWLLVEGADEVRRAVVATAQTAYLGIDPSRPMGKDARTFAGELAGTDWVSVQLATYEYGGLRRFLSTMADRSFVSQGDQIEQWLDAPMGGYCLEDVVDDRLLVTDLASGRLLEVMNLASSWGREAGTTVLGRLVPIAVAPGLMFESRPLTVDPTTAREVAVAIGVAPGGWTDALARARRHDRLLLGFSVLVPTSYLTDLPGGGMTGLEVDGVTIPGPDGAVALVDLVLNEVDVNPAAAAHLSFQLVSLLVDGDLRKAVSQRCTDGSRCAAWAEIGRALPEPMRGYALAMAVRASRSAA